MGERETGELAESSRENPCLLFLCFCIRDEGRNRGGVEEEKRRKEKKRKEKKRKAKEKKNWFWSIPKRTADTLH